MYFSWKRSQIINKYYKDIIRILKLLLEICKNELGKKLGKQIEEIGLS